MDIMSLPNEEVQTVAVFDAVFGCPAVPPLASRQALRKGEGEGKESLVATVCACADFLSRESPRACYVSHKTSFKHGFNHEGLSFVVKSNRSVLILGNTTAMKKQWVTILVSRAKRTTEQNTSSSRQYTLTYDV